MTIIIKNKATLIYDDFEFKCSIGKGGFTKKKVEGDKKTPIGIFKLGPLYFRKDKKFKPVTKLKKIPILKNFGWCDDVNHKNYNKLVKVNEKIHHEKLYRKDSKYDLLIPIQYNTKIPKKGKGSAIFIHLTENYKKTAGCIVLKKKDFLILIKLIKKNTLIQIN